jgi:hypothetical protein
MCSEDGREETVLDLVTLKKPLGAQPPEMSQQMRVGRLPVRNALGVQAAMSK